jgi:hypothetical protein
VPKRRNVTRFAAVSPSGVSSASIGGQLLERHPDLGVKRLKIIPRQMWAACWTRLGTTSIRERTAVRVSTPLIQDPLNVEQHACQAGVLELHGLSARAGQTGALGRRSALAAAGDRAAHVFGIAAD